MLLRMLEALLLIRWSKEEEPPGWAARSFGEDMPLLFRSGRSGRTRSGCSWARSGRAWCTGRALRASSRRRCGDSRLGVVGLNDGGSNVGLVAAEKHGAVLLRDVHDQAYAIGRGELLHHIEKLLADTRGDLVALLRVVVLRVFGIALKNLLLGFDGLHARVALGFAELVGVGAQIFLKPLNRVVGTLELVLLGVEFLVEGLEVTTAFIGCEDGLLEVDQRDLADASGRHSGGLRSSGRGSRLRKGRGAKQSQGGGGESENLACHRINGVAP